MVGWSDAEIRWPQRRIGHYVESIVTKGLDFWKPYKRASNSWRIDVKASSSNNARMRSHNRRLLPNFVHTALQRAQHRCWVWSTKNASSISMANTPERGCSPCP